MSIELALINPREGGPDKYPPISLLCLAAYARRSGHSVVIIDAQAEGLSDDEVAERVMSAQPALCGVTFMTNQVGIVRKLVARLSLLRKQGLTVKFVAGGMHVSILPDEARDLGFDFCVVGEGEETLVQLLHALRTGASTESIEGLWGNRFRPRKLVEDLDTLPLPAWDLVPIEKYAVSQPELRYTRESGVCLSISGSRGCLYNCVFCSSHGVYGRTHRERSPANIVDEMEMLCTKYGVRKFFMVDESILGNAERAEAIAEEISKRRLKIQYASPARVSDRGVNLKTLARLRESGMLRVDFGVETGAQRILDDTRKGITIEQIVNAHRLAHEAGMRTTSLMIVGHLEEAWEDVLDSLALIGNLQTDEVVFGPMTPYPGTEVYSKALKEGWIRNFDWGMYYITNSYRVMRNRHFTHQEIYLLYILCTDATRFMTAWKQRELRSWYDFYRVLGTGRMRLKAVGRFWLAMYILTRDRAFLRELKLEQIKRTIYVWAMDVIQNPEDATLLAGVRKNPLSVLKRPARKRLLELLVPLVMDRVKESFTTPLYRVFYAYRLAAYSGSLRKR
ncbi:MAG: radical SAM protein [Candidatus Bathyarchaeia archaeon]|jgi:anaerobic magnesium-protoporphyrin IX monomethyl ester cyclase